MDKKANEPKDRVYLQLPKAGKEAYRKIVDDVKKRGAKFDETRKAWYIAPEQTEVFQPYLSTNFTPPPQRIYVSFPYPSQSGGKSFQEIVEEFKQNGAKFDGKKRKWYIWPEQEEAFQNYLLSLKTIKTHPKPDANSLYLELPNLERAKFCELVSELKEKGAYYHPEKKRWYIQPEQAEHFQDYLPKPILPIPPEEEDSSIHFRKILKWIDHLEQKYEIQLLNGEKCYIEESEILHRNQVSTISKLTLTEIEESIEAILEDRYRIIEDHNYSIFVGEDKLSVLDRNKELKSIPAIQGMRFSSLTDKDLFDLAAYFFQEEKNLQTFYIPEYQESFIKGVQKIQGFITKEEPEQYRIKDLAGRELSIQKKETYTLQQVAILERVSKQWPDNLKETIYDLIGDPELDAGQMEAIEMGFKKGLNPYELAYYSNPKYEKWQMELFCQGLVQGAEADRLEAILKQNNNTQNSNIEVEKAIYEGKLAIQKDIEKHGFHATNEAIQKIIHLNHLTAKRNTLEDICRAFQEKRYHGVAGRIIHELGTDFLKQQKMSLAKKKIPVR